MRSFPGRMPFYKEVLLMGGLRHILSADQFTPEFIAEVIAKAKVFAELLVDGHTRRETLGALHRGKLLFNVFYQPSTRTRFSFGAAGHHLGMNVIHSENAAEFSSAKKGEKTEHTADVLPGYYPDTIVMRHHKTGEVAKAAEHSTVPIINAGDGQGEHPTQAMLDLYTIEQLTGRLDRLCIMLGGDLKDGRTIHSLVRLLSLYPGNELILASPRELAMPEELVDLLRSRGTRVSVSQDLPFDFSRADIVYWTRLQDPEKYPHLRATYAIRQEQMSWLRPHAFVMHPMPIDSNFPEIDPSVEGDPRMKFIQQAHNGLPVRMALIDWVLGGW